MLVVPIYSFSIKYRSFNLMVDYIIDHPLYIPFIILNIYIIYKLIRVVLGKDQGHNDNDDDGGLSDNDNPQLDLPPGVILPVPDNEPVFDK